MAEERFYERYKNEKRGKLKKKFSKQKHFTVRC